MLEGSLQFHLMFLLGNNGFDNFVVHRGAADPRNLRRHLCPMKESLAIAGKAGSGSGPLCIVIGCNGVALDQLTCIILE